MNNELNSFSVLQFTWKWRKLLICVSLAAALLSFAIALFIKPLYKSTAILYAPRTNAVSKTIMNNSNNNERLDVRSYGIEEETEQMMQILHSRELKDAIADKYNLIEYYELDTNSKHLISKLYQDMGDNISIKRTQFGAISITVTDKCPQMAADLANGISDELDLMKNKIEYERANAAVKLIESQMNDVNCRLAEIADTVQILANHGIFIYDLQVERVMQQYAKALGDGNMAGAQRLLKEIEKIAKFGPTSVLLREDLIALCRHLAYLRTLKMNAQMDMSGTMPVKFVVEKAVAISKKVFPKKSIIMIFSTLAAFTITFFSLLIFEKIKNENFFSKKEDANE